MTTKPPIFKPEHFAGINDLLFKNAYDAAADIANRIIESKLGPKVYKYKTGSELPHAADWSPVIDDDFGGIAKYTHTAYLFDIQKLPEKECEHEPPLNELFMKFGLLNAKCRHCGVGLTAKWEVKK